MMQKIAQPSARTRKKRRSSEAELVAASPGSVRGAVESLAGAYLTGWAINIERATPCAITVRDEAGMVVSSGSAGRPRSDLAALGFGRADFAFRIPVETLGASPLLRVFADEIELAGSPLATGAGHWDGAVSVHHGWAEGWVHERRLNFTPPVVEIFDHEGHCLGAGEAVTGEGDRLFRAARFRIALGAEAWRRPEVALRACVDGAAFAGCEAALTLKGYLDRLDDRRCAGWLFSPEAPARRFGIEVRRDGVVIATGPAELPREDLRSPFPDGWRSGFDLELPKPEHDDQPARLSVRLAGSDVELFEGPFLIGKRRDFIAPARRLAARALALDLDPLERRILQEALGQHIGRCREGTEMLERHALPPEPGPAARRFTVIIPIYRNVAVTRACIDSVLAHRDPAWDAVLLINDASPEAEMAPMLAGYADQPQVYVLTNQSNRGFVRSVNRGLAFCREGDVILLNSDTRVFAGGLAELWAAAHAQPGIGTATALSNNATIFSYPVCDQGCETLDDIDWADTAAIALAANQGLVIDVPTGHGFCMLITRDMLARVGAFDEIFGRGYGEENDFCQRGADLGFRNIAAAGVFVEHRESLSFGADKASLLQQNLGLLERRYPEYAGAIRGFLKNDDLRGARWAIDAERLRQASARGARFVLLVRNWLDGGTGKAIEDIGAHIGFGGAQRLEVCVDIGGMIRLTCAAPSLCAVFAQDECDALFAVLDAAEVATVQVHQVLGYGAAFIAALGDWCEHRQASYYIHDYYPICPRVTMIDASGVFCDVAPVEVCARCVALGDAHDASRLPELAPAEHRALFDSLLLAMDRVLAPSASASAYIARVMPQHAPTVAQHPEAADLYRVKPRTGSLNDIVLLGAIGPHKGSAKLLDVAQRARLAAPDLRFHVIGYTDIDPALRALGNVSVTGKYEPAELPDLVAATGARIALFLHLWPETFSYTLSEAVQLGLIPVVPDIGAPADRVRMAGFGHVFAFPIEAATVIDTLSAIADGRIDPAQAGATPFAFAEASP